MSKRALGDGGSAHLQREQLGQKSGIVAHMRGMTGLWNRRGGQPLKCGGKVMGYPAASLLIQIKFPGERGCPRASDPG